jgi:hypothetical protein
MFGEDKGIEIGDWFRHCYDTPFEGMASMMII